MKDAVIQPMPNGWEMGKAWLLALEKGNSGENILPFPDKSPVIKAAHTVLPNRFFGEVVGQALGPALQKLVVWPFAAVLVFYPR